MQNNNFFTKTSIPRPKIDYKTVWSVDRYNLSDSRPRWFEYASNKRIWDDEVYNKLASVDLVPTQVRLFRWYPGIVGPWHIDGTNAQVTEFSINWVLDGIGMIQWDSKLKIPESNKELEYLVYGFIKQGQLDEPWEEQTPGNGCIIDTSVPHRVINTHPIHRVSASVLFGNQFKYAEAVERLRSCGYIE